LRVKDSVAKLQSTISFTSGKGLILPSRWRSRWPQRLVKTPLLLAILLLSGLLIYGLLIDDVNFATTKPASDFDTNVFPSKP
jgi:hypothetical protein